MEQPKGHQIVSKGLFRCVSGSLRIKVYRIRWGFCRGYIDEKKFFDANLPFQIFERNFNPHDPGCEYDL